MVKHIILWTLKEDFSEKEKNEIKKQAKAALEGLTGKIPGLLELCLQTEGLPSSNADMMLYSVFESEPALTAYQTHALHVAAANQFVRPYTAQRLCLDFKA